MKYMLLIYSKEQDWTEEEYNQCIQTSTQLCNELTEAGQFLAASPLQSVSVATSIQVRDNRRMVTDGPFAETTEQLGGYFLIDVPDLDQAISIASRIPAAKKGTVEIRPVNDLGNLPG